MSQTFDCPALLWLLFSHHSLSSAHSRLCNPESPALVSAVVCLRFQMFPCSCRRQQRMQTDIVNRELHSDLRRLQQELAIAEGRALDVASPEPEPEKAQENPFKVVCDGPILF